MISVSDLLELVRDLFPTKRCSGTEIGLSMPGEPVRLVEDDGGDVRVTIYCIGFDAGNRIQNFWWHEDVVMVSKTAREDPRISLFLASWSRTLVRLLEMGLMNCELPPMNADLTPVNLVPLEVLEDSNCRTDEQFVAAMLDLLERRLNDRLAGDDEPTEVLFPPESFPPIEPAALRFLGERLAAAIAVQPSFERICELLVGYGGLHVVAPPRSPDPDVDALLVAGYLFHADAVKMVQGHASQCHSNVSRLWMENPEKFTIVVGYALSSDGLWRQHTWGLHDGDVVETTESRLLYWGVSLSHEDARMFASVNG